MTPQQLQAQLDAQFLAAQQPQQAAPDQAALDAQFLAAQSKAPAAPAAPQYPGQQPGYVSPIQSAPMGLLEGAKERGLGVLQSVYMGGPGGLLGRGARDLIAAATGADPHKELDYAAMVADQLGHRAGMLRQDFERSKAGGTKTGKGARVVGTIAPDFAIPGGGASRTARVGTAMLGGLANALTSPVEKGNYVNQKATDAAWGAGLGAVGQTGLNLVGDIAKYAGRFTDTGAAKRAWDWIKAEADNPGRLTRTDPSKVPGYTRSLADETRDAGVARLERRSRDQDQGWTDRDRVNNLAHIKALEGFAGTKDSLDNLIAARDAATKPLRQQALALNGADTNRLISQLGRVQQRLRTEPDLQAGINKVRNLLKVQIPDNERIKNALVPLSAIQRGQPDYQNALEAMRAFKRGEVPQIKFNSQRAKDAFAEAKKQFGKEFRGEDNMAQLYGLRKTIGRMLDGSSGDNMRGYQRELIAVRDQLDRVMAKRAPEYQQYLNTYKKMSGDINRQQIGQNLMGGKSGAAVLDEVAGREVTRLLPASFSKRALDLDKVARESTGFRKAKAGNFLFPGDINTITNVRRDLQRRDFTTTKGTGGGSPTRSLQALDERLASDALEQIPYIGKTLKYLGTRGDIKAKQKMTDLLRNPSFARRIASLPPAVQRQMPAWMISAINQNREDATRDE